jgi:short subunit dehydrogenase-like uncharacterized protein
MPPDDKFDVVLWGATGAVGRRVAHHFALRNETCGLRWAIGGRSEEKLKALRADLPAGAQNIPIIVGDSFDRTSLDVLAARARVVCSTVGPYAKYGSELVAACARTGTHYCDLSGEPHWMRWMIDAHQTTAASSGARIVHACGFDSVPSDLGVYLVQTKAEKEHGRPCDHIKMRVTAMRGGFSGGTAASLIYGIEEGRRNASITRLMTEPYALNPEGERQGPDQPEEMMAFKVRFDEDLRGWTMPFFMSPINTKVVRRTNALLDFRYGRNFRYEEAILVGRGAVRWALAVLGAFLGSAFMHAMGLSPVRRLLKKYVLPKPGEGPNREVREKSSYDIVQLGKIDNEIRVRARIRGKGDPGVESTSRMLVECALCLAEDSERIAVGGGFWTPASAMGDLLLERLPSHAGLTFEIAETGTK